MASTNSPSRQASPAEAAAVPAPATPAPTRQPPASPSSAREQEAPLKPAESRTEPTPKPQAQPEASTTAMEAGGLPDDRGAFEPEKETHFDKPDGGFYAGSRKDFPLPACRYPLPRTSVKRLSEPEPGTKGGRQRHYTDDPNHPLQGFWTEAGTWVDWPPKSSTPGPDGKEQEQQQQHGHEKAREPDHESDKADRGNQSGPASETTASKTGGTATVSASDDRDQQEAANTATAHSTANTTASSRRQTNGTIGSVYSGNKIRHLKKDDGIPLWRKDIQHLFLRLVFEDTTPVFTRLSDGKGGLTFADIYIDAMAKSSKTSKVLKDKLTSDRPAAINMAMVCLLVNFGRMNTTLNFFPEMRAQLRTYHSIPSLQAHQDSSAYKQLQDAPRLKSILKGASEDIEQPNTIEKLRETPVPRTNPVNLIFILAQYAPKISEMHFHSPHDFFDLVMRATLSSRSRATAFLWLMWFYLESDFSDEAALKNPFGPGVVGDGTDGSPLKIPPLEDLTEEEADAENVDTQDEILYGEEKQKERRRILDDDDIVSRNKRVKKDNMSDDQMSGDIPTSGTPAGRDKQSTCFTPLNHGRRLGDEEDEELQTPVQSLRSRNKRKRDSSATRSSTNPGRTRIVLKTKMDQTPDASSPVPPGSSHPVLHQFTAGSPAPGQTPSSSRRPRPLTQHQLAIEQNRRQRVDYILAQRRAEEYSKARQVREDGSRLIRAGRLLQCLPVDYDTDDDRSWGKGGLCLNPDAQQEDFGEAGSFYFSVLKKVARRMHRWDWQAIASGDKDIGPNGLMHDHALELGDAGANAGMGEEEEAEPSAAAPSRSSRGGRRDRKSNANADKLSTPDPSRLAAPPSGGKRQYIRRKPLPERKPGEGGRRVRPSRSKAALAAAAAAKAEAAANKALAIKQEVNATGTSAAGSELGLPSSPARDVHMKEAGEIDHDHDHDDEDGVLDDIDKDILGDASTYGGDDVDEEIDAEGESHLSVSPLPDPDQEPGSEAVARQAGMTAATEGKTLPASINSHHDSDDSTEEDVVATALAAADTPDTNGYADEPGHGRNREHVDGDGDEIMAQG
ncbi:putative RNA helicase [Microsporum audouinii]